MGSIIRFCIVYLLLSQHAFSMELLLDDRPHIQLRQPLPTLINYQQLEKPADFWLTQEYSTDQFLRSTQPSPLTSWHKLEITGKFNSPYSQKRIISIESHILRHLNIYLFDNDKLIKKTELGLLDRVNSANTPFNGTHFQFYIQNNQHLTLLIEKQNNGPAILPMSIYSEDGFNHFTRFQNFFWASIISILISLAIYNVFVYAMYPSSAYLWYLVFHFCAFFYFAGLNGFGFLFLPQAIQTWIAQNIMFLNFALIFLSINFANIFLQSKDNAQWHYRYMLHFRVVSILGGLASLIFTEYEMMSFFIVYQFLASVYGFSMGIIALKNGFSPAKYFLLSWAFTLIGGAIGMATAVNSIAINFITLHAFLFGTILELFLLSIALASRIKHMENNLLNQLYYYPDTNIANFGYLKSKLPEHIKDIKHNHSNPVFVLANMQGFREIVSLYGPNVLTRLYRTHTDRINHFLSTKPWTIAFPMPIGKPTYIIGLPGEQILFMLDIPHDDIELALDKILNNIIKEAEHVFNSKQLTSTIKFTLACTVIGDNDIQEAFRQTQVALLSSNKENKKWQLYKESQDKAISQRISMIHELQMAINQNDLSIYAQPQVNLNDDTIIGCEILLRWNHPDQGSISPARFIPLAEQSGLIFQITQLVFLKSCSWLAQSKNKGILHDDFTISINLSALDMAEKSLISFISDCLNLFKLDAKYFILEVTESAVMDNPNLFLDTINQLKALGFKISIDDFGTGYSSMLYLKNIEPYEIKIDMAFIRNIHLNKRKENIVKAIVQLAHSSHAIIVAEGVQNKEELDFITSLQCDIAQGYLWCPAIPLHEFEHQYFTPLA